MWLWLLPESKRFEALEKVLVHFIPRAFGQRVTQWLLSVGTALVFTRYPWCSPLRLLLHAS